MDEQTSSDSNYFTQLAMREFSEGNVNPGNRDFRTPTELREAILREIEKEKIREGIIAMEKEKIREGIMAMENELRRSSQTVAECEHQLSSQGQGNKDMFPFAASAIRYEPTTKLPSAEEMIGTSLEERLGIFAAARRGLAVVAECEHQLSSQRHGNKDMFPFAASAIRYEPTMKLPSAEEMSGMSLEERLGILAAARRGLAAFHAIPPTL